MAGAEYAIYAADLSFKILSEESRKVERIIQQNRDDDAFMTLLSWLIKVNIWQAHIV